MRALFTALILLLTVSSHAAPLKLCFEDVPQPPWTMPDGTGLNFELLKRVEKQLGERFDYEAKPWKRCIEEMRAGVVDGVIDAADSPERRAFSSPPTLADGKANPAAALCEDKFNVYMRLGSSASWDGKRLRSPNDMVVVPAGYVVGDMLRAQGLQVKEVVKSAFDALRMLANGSHSVAVLQGALASELVKTNPLFRERIVEAATPYEVLPLYLMVSNKTLDREPARIKAIWQSIKVVRASDEYRKLDPSNTH